MSIKITEKQKDLLEFLMNNQTAIEELLNTFTTLKHKQAKDLQMKESISLAGITWSKFAEDSEGNAYMLADEKICDMKFGENNDWRESPIRKKLNNDLHRRIVEEIGENALLTIETDLFSHDGLEDYGKCEDVISLLTYDLYRNNRKNIKNIGSWWWLSTPNSTPSGYGSGYVRYVFSGGGVGCDDCGCSRGLRPFFILRSDKEVIVK